MVKGVFHVKQHCAGTNVSRETSGSRGRQMNKEILFTYTKVSKDHVENIFHIDPT